MGLLPAPAHAQSSPSALTATDLLAIQEIQKVVLSPSGRNIAYTVRRPDTTGEMPTDRTQLYVASSSGRDAPRLLTRGPDGARQPTWHPDGNQLAFVRSVGGTPQVFVLSLSGGEPYQLTDVPHGATHPTWGPSGDRLLFASRIPAPVLHRRGTHQPFSPRPGRAPQDTVRRWPPETVLVLRSKRSLDPVDTLALDATDRLRPATDTSRTLQVPTHVTPPDSLQPLRIDSLRTLAPDSLQAVFRQVQLLPDTTTRPVSPDTAAHPDGDLLQRRRWLDQQSPADAQVFARNLPQAPGQSPQARYRHYFVTDVPETIGTTTPPRPQARPVTTGFRSFRGGTWLPGGSQIVVSAPPPPTDSTTAQAHNLYLVDVASSRTQRLLQIDGYTLSQPSLTTDGTTLAFHAQPLSAPSYEHCEIGLFELDGRSNPTLITEDFPYDPQLARWSPDGWYLYVTAPVQGGRSIYRFAPFAQDDTTDAPSGRRRTSLQNDYSTSRDTFALDATMRQTATNTRVTSPKRFVQALDVTDSKAVYAASTRKNPSELYANTVSFNNEKRLSAHNADWTQRRYFSASKRVETWNDGARIPGRLTLPSMHRDTARTPMAVLLRGGPPALAASSFLGAWTERQHLVERGYGVLEVWPRGSQGFGEAFRKHNFQDWGPGPASDVLALTDSVLAEHWTHTPPQVLFGRGYGGTLAAWLAGHTDRFEAIAAQSGVYDLDAFFGESNTGALITDQFGGRPWETTPPAQPPVTPPRPLLSAGLVPPPDSAMSPQATLRRSAPLTTAHQIDTPLLLLHGADDAVVSPTQTERLYRRLKSRHHPVEYVRYPNAGHSLDTASPTQRMDRLVRLHAFFARYVSTP